MYVQGMTSLMRATGKTPDLHWNVLDVLLYHFVPPGMILTWKEP